MSNYLSQDELAVLLDKPSRKIKQWVEMGMAAPVNPDTYRSDGGYRFSEEEYARLKLLFGPDMLSLSDAAKLIGISKQYLTTLAKADPPEISSQLINYGKQPRRIFRRADCESLKAALRMREGTQYKRESGYELSLYGNNVRLFDTFTLQNQRVLVISVDPVKLLSENEYIIEPTRSIPISRPCADLPYEKRTGTIIFNIPKLTNVNDKIYAILSKMVEYLGTKNIRVFDRGDVYVVRCRKSQFQGNYEEAAVLKKYKVEGYLHVSGNTIELDGAVVTKRTNISKSLFHKIEEIANTTNQSFDVTLNMLLSKALQVNESDKEPDEEESR